jgi:hypothetical protein
VLCEKNCVLCEKNCVDTPPPPRLALTAFTSLSTST